MSKFVKCSNCNIVIDELLAYVQNKVSVIDEQTLVRICLSAFNSDEIKKSKSLLYDSISTDLRKIIRKNKGKEERDILDIVHLIKSTDPDEIPIFVAKQLEKLPPILFDHLDCTKLLRDILKLQTTVDEIKSNYVTHNNLKDFKEDLCRSQNDNNCVPPSALNANMNRVTRTPDSGPMGLSQVPITPFSSPKNNTEDKQQNFSKNDKTDLNLLKVNLKDLDTSQRTARTVEFETGLLVTSAQVSPAALSLHQLTTTAEQCKDNANNVQNEWKTVEKRKKQNKYRYIGKSGTARDEDFKEFNFKAAERKTPIFITNIHNDTMKESIEKYILSKTQESVLLEQISMKIDRGYKAYKFFVNEAKLFLFLDENLWPEGIVFRRFVNYKSRKLDSCMRTSNDR